MYIWYYSMLSVIIVCYSYMLYVIQLYSCSHIQIYNVKHTYTCIQLYTYVLPFLYIYIYTYIYTIIQLYTYIYMSILRYISLNCSSMLFLMKCSTFSAVMVNCLSPKSSFPISVLQHWFKASTFHPLPILFPLNKHIWQLPHNISIPT